MKKKKTQIWKMWNQDCEVRVKNKHLLAILVIDRIIIRLVRVLSFVLLWVRCLCKCRDGFTTQRSELIFLSLVGLDSSFRVLKHPGHNNV